ncbi:ABC transporter ATP-binding protein [Anaerocolumna aminovalerica]|mgnify:CR=1 FL=1|uniref:Amino acid/amide ABC transporter ATP-binding protein 1, HAAT family n=1 Tax=Anaerocolumna aminovalerica TaxID=1527 RepID=A0A1I5GQ77_9FIRM|nr:ABC transporter ATP-binding protein [Anaerocolumna aminovalerica]MBU5331194.1 ABC transporter ATP-binding protein [Anaerocolumna aminovalerica]MDU6263230.1 ABC transporter ATP-binding protein [Anaerocolumna aminovalerica]SFO37721.1 amino acid/amide ABC transporter ATP-binding protein 1, HAAT family [Anaerocolumna aminovalerica]
MLKLEDVTIKFGGLTAVNNVSLEIPEGSIFGLIGPNGAGKTTLFNLISGVYKPTSGKIYFQEKEIEGTTPYKVNELGIARTYQNINLFKKMTTLENVMVGCHTKSKAGIFDAVFKTKKQKSEEKAIIEKSMNILEFMGLKDKAYYKASNLSYGEQRRLEISRAMASEPKLILLDEPAAGMNANEKLELNDTIQKMNKLGITVLLVEHDMKVVMNICDTVCVLNYGKRLCVGEPDYVQNNEEVIEAYLGGDIDV